MRKEERENITVGGKGENGMGFFFVQKIQRFHLVSWSSSKNGLVNDGSLDAALFLI